MPANPSPNPRSPILFTSEGWGCAKCHKKISECICPERQGTRCNHPWPCSKEDDSDYDDELGLGESREPLPQRIEICEVCGENIGPICMRIVWWDENAKQHQRHVIDCLAKPENTCELPSVPAEIESTEPKEPS